MARVGWLDCRVFVLVFACLEPSNFYGLSLVSPRRSRLVVPDPDRHLRCTLCGQAEVMLGERVHDKSSIDRARHVDRDVRSLDCAIGDAHLSLLRSLAQPFTN